MESLSDAASDGPSDLVRVDLGENGGLVRLLSYHEIESWLKKEVEFWSPLTFNRNEEFGRRLQALQTKLARASNSFRENPSEARLLGARQTIEDLYVNEKLPHSESPLGRHISKLQSRSGASAAHAFAVVMTRNNNDPRIPEQLTIDSLNGILQALEFNHAFHTESQRDALNSYIETINESVIEASSKATGIIARLEILEDQHVSFGIKAKAEFETFSKRSDEIFDESTKANTSQLGEHQSKLQEIQTAFMESMKLKAPAEYWKKKLEGHKNGTIALTIAVVLSMTFAIIWLSGIASHLLDTPKSSVSLDTLQLSNASAPAQIIATPGESSSYHPWKLAKLVIASVFCVWIIRLLIRILLSQMHLAADASERITMVTTYLALTNDGHASVDDRGLILQALFRPATTGMVKDEGAPPSFIETVTRLKQ